MRLGGLFSGVGGFELAWTQLGHEVAWMCEWDAKARRVLEARFPGVPIYPDVRDLDPAEVEAVDVLTGGSPCQGFSVAGNRTGLEHSESQLFRDYIRIMDGLADRGLKYALWENVPGVLSITNEDGERTFSHVVAALAGGTEPVRLRDDKRWNTGLAAGRGRAVAWRVLDSRYFGVAQRRRRVFACVAFGDSCEDRAGRALLAVAEGVRGDSASGQPEGEGSAGGVEERAGNPSVTGTVSAKWAKGTGGPSGDEAQNLVTDFPSFGMIGGSGQEGATVEEQPAITASHGQPGNVAQAFNWQSGGDARGLDLTDETSALTCQQTPEVMLHVRGGVDRDRHGKLAGKGPLLSYELSATLDATQPWTLFEPKAFRKSGRAQSSEDAESWVEDGQANTLNVFDVGDTRTTHAIVEPKEEMVDFGRTSDRIRINANTAATLQAGGGGAGAKTGLYVDEYAAEETGTLQARGYKGLNHENVRDGRAVVQTYGVRRLTPVECERLQSFPDGWTEPAGSDSARYKAMGNAVTVNVVRWILGRLT